MQRRAMFVIGIAVASVLACGAPSAVSATSTGGSLKSVACTSAGDCVAVGVAHVGTTNQTPLAERWNGSAWSVMPGASSSGPQPYYVGVACASTMCVAVGLDQVGSVSHPRAERWNGTAWSTITPKTPAGATSAELDGVACPSANSCVAAGSATTGGASLPIVEHWNGSSWSLTQPPLPSGAASASLAAITCGGATNCFAVGTAAFGATNGTLVERWNGSAWAVVSSPDPAGATISNLFAVACLSPTNCFAGGRADSGNRFLVEHWNGTKWSLGSMPTIGSPWPGVQGLACAAPSNCMAITRYGTGHWNGSHWTAAGLAPTTGTAELTQGVACTGATSCVAVGDSVSPGPSYRTLVEMWNGTTWHVVPSP